MRTKKLPKSKNVVTDQSVNRVAKGNRNDAPRTADGKTDRNRSREFRQAVSKDFRKQVNVTVKKKTK